MSVSAYLAEQSVNQVRDNMDESYTYYLTFRTDGVTTHYTVTRHDTSEPGKITLTYWTDDNKLDITNIENIKTLTIDVQSLFEDEASKVFKSVHTDIPTMDLDYWLEAKDGIFVVEFELAAGEPIESLTFTKFPEPKSVLVNNQEWWKTNMNYVKSGKEITITNIPTGSNTVILYFKETNQAPIPSFTMNPNQYANVMQNISFDGSASSDPDGSIAGWIWDFGDNSSDSGKSTLNHAYTKPGTYTIRLTVRDNAVPYAEAWIEKSITVTYGAGDDFDDDGLDDKWEWDHFTTLDQDGFGDPDADGYPNGLEYVANSDPSDVADFKNDSDTDSLPDLWEWQYFENLDETASGDFDSDTATNTEEQAAGTDPTDPNDFPEIEGTEKEGEEEGSNLLWIIIVVVIILVLIPVFMMFMKSRSQKAEEDQAISEMEAKIEKAREMGLPTRDLERLLKQAKEGKGLEGKGEQRERKGGSRQGQEQGRDRKGGGSGGARRRR
jgi:PKD repeat protein